MARPIEAAHTIDDRKCEQIDGVVYMMASPVIEHAVITNNISAAIKEDLVDHPCFVSMENVDFKYNSDIADDEDYRGDYLLPDIMIMEYFHRHIPLISFCLLYHLPIRSLAHNKTLRYNTAILLQGVCSVNSRTKECI